MITVAKLCQHIAQHDKPILTRIHQQAIFNTEFEKKHANKLILMNTWDLEPSRGLLKVHVFIMIGISSKQTVQTIADFWF